jgi:hypothetical protein
MPASTPVERGADQADALPRNFLGPSYPVTVQKELFFPSSFYKLLES